MAAIFIVAGMAIAEKVEKKKEAKRQKKAKDEARYRELQIETNRRLTRKESGNDATQDTFIENPEDLDDGEDSMNLRQSVSDTSPPPYEDAVQVGERREREWQAQMQRRRSSVNSNRSNSAVHAMRMG
ncbi:hypothetical protein LTR37_000479 [Vermiconidia calcicola]|uniref:Uncharacterized protein n=1 Tax=Vermiconidia calcicola TaxID=1690605 RepID=A0ACC3P0J0_9PEZI|nr:hypothetical protein LTR37_000479 [Vermiconidia calcicola]